MMRKWMHELLRAVAVDGWKSAVPGGAEQLERFGLRPDLDHALEPEADLLEDGDRARVVRSRDRHYALEPQPAATELEHRGGGLARVAARPVPCQEGKSEVHVRQVVALQQATDADR